MRRVVVTGVGVLSSIGNTVARFEESLRAGRSGIGPITQVDTSRLRFHNAAEIQGFEPAEHFFEVTWLDRFAQLGIVAAEIEKFIRAYPGQWIWIHRRWKTRPSGRPSLY